jgi:RNA polymerase sigma-70 factor, ECF subfamily
MHQPHRRRRKPRRRAATAIEQRERLCAIAQQIKILPPDQRAALVLREFEGLSYEQVADVLQTTVSAIKGRLHRARLTLLKETTAWR